MEKTWRSAPSSDEAKTISFAREMVAPPLIARLLLQRGIDNLDNARSFFRPDLQDLIDPFEMKDMDKAVERLTQAFSSGEKVLIYGDYDVDGTTAVSLVLDFLRKKGLECDYYIPDRYQEGYGFSFAGVEFAKENGFGLIITLDCGIKDGAKIQQAGSYGIDVIVCDHHQPSEIPPACAVLDPKRPDCSYPYKGLSGCGVGFKLLQAFCIQHSIPQEEIFDHLDLVTISIAADIVPLTGENRILAYHGLRLMSSRVRPGIAALLDAAGFRKTAITISDLVFVIAPRINAAGRIFSGRQAVDLLLSEDPAIARQLSLALEENNRTRKDLDKEITQAALDMIDNDPFFADSFTTIVAGKDWSKGVVGIVASRIIERHYKPTIVLCDDGEKLSGSARSIEGIDIYDVLTECSSNLIQYGGHTMAAGLSLKRENLQAFRIEFDEAVKRRFNGKKPCPAILYDSEISLNEINPGLMKWLKRFEPFGPENMKPVFLSRSLCNARFTRVVGDSKNHLKLHLKHPGNSQVTCEGIGFDLGNWEKDLVNRNAITDMVFTLEENEWNNKVSIQVNVKDIRYSEAEVS